MAKSGFQDLDIYKKTVVLRRNVFELSKSFPFEDRFRLTIRLLEVQENVRQTSLKVMVAFIIKRIPILQNCQRISL
jgi:hypothetical protein